MGRAILIYIFFDKNLARTEIYHLFRLPPLSPLQAIRYLIYHIH